jgi:site-specific DNA recombinase
VRALLYCRVSTDPQERDSSGLDTQESACRSLAEAQGWTVVTVVRDTASGYTLTRPGLDQVRAMLPEVDLLVVQDFDRLAREQIKMAVILGEAIDNGVQLWAVEGGAFDNTAVGKFLHNARTFAAELEREKITERTSRGRRYWAERGKYIGKVPYGYRRNGDGLEVVEDRAAVVRRIFDLYLTGNVGLRRIAMILNAEGIPAARGGPWYANTIAWMLSNEAYTGVMRWKDIRREGHIPAIISCETWQAAQARRSRKAAIGGGQAQTGRHLLTGVLFCAQCKGRMSGKFARSRERGTVRTYRGYQCSRNQHGGGCVTNWHDADDLEARVMRDLGTLAPLVRLDEQRYERTVEALRRVETALKRNRGRRLNVIDAIADGRLAEDDVRVIDEERERLEAECDRLRDEVATLETVAALASERPSRVRRVLDTSLPLAERKVALQEIVERIEVSPGDPEPLILE